MDVLCFGGEDWWYHNRGHIDMQLMRRFAKQGTVLYVNSIVMQRPRVAKGNRLFMKLCRKAKSILRGVRKTEAGFWVYSPLSLPMHHLAWARSFNTSILRQQVRFIMRRLGMANPIVWIACPAACEIALQFNRRKLVYQRTDRFEEFPNVDVEQVKKYDRKLKSNADLTIFVSKAFYDREAGECKNPLYLDHGVDYELFAFAEKDNAIPSDIANVPKPIIGFFGEIETHTVDADLLGKVADCLPNMSFVLIGQIVTDCSRLLSRKNVYALGKKPYELIPHYGKCFDVAIMPWRANEWIKDCNPVKLKEYLALGLPVVSTPFNELSNYSDVVYEAGTPEDFARCIEKALVENNAELIATRRRRVRDSTWDKKAQLVYESLFGKMDDFLGLDSKGKTNDS